MMNKIKKLVNKLLDKVGEGLYKIVSFLTKKRMVEPVIVATVAINLITMIMAPAFVTLGLLAVEAFICYVGYRTAKLKLIEQMTNAFESLDIEGIMKNFEEKAMSYSDVDFQEVVSN